MTTGHHDPRYTFRALLDQRAVDDADRPFVTFDDEVVTFGDLRRRVTATANQLIELGLRPGETVAMLTLNSAEWVDVWFAAAEVGAVSTPVNAAFRGDYLVHQLRDAEAAVVLVDELLLPLLTEVADQLPGLRVVIVRGDAAGATADPALAGKVVVSARTLQEGATDRVQRGAPIPWNRPACLFYTSGTTGPSKGAVLTQHYLLSSASTFVDAYRFRRDDVIYGAVPLFHFSGSLGVVLPALLTGMAGVLDPAFSVHSCWDRVRAADATIFVGVGPMLMMLWSLPPEPADAELPLRLVVAAPVPAEMHGPIEERYGVTIVGGYGMTEVFPLALHRVGTPIAPGSAGLPNPAFDVQVVDDDDLPVASGEVGEIVCRPQSPHVMFEGYRGRPEATLAQLGNLWFHTGDLGRLDADGVLWFVDRKKDAIRRRGENISSFEVERTVLAHPAVLECAAHAVPSEVGEDDVKICVVVNEGMDLDPADLLEHCVQHMPKFAVPRYIEVVDALPKNAVGRVQKAKLRERPIGPGTWDRDRATASA